MPAYVCACVRYNGPLFYCMLLACIVQIWLVLLVGIQIVQMSRQLTTLEASNLGRYGFMGGRGASLKTQYGYMQQQTERMAAAGMDRDLIHEQLHGRSKRKVSVATAAGNAGNWLLSIVGLDLFTRGKAGRGYSRSNAAANPFDHGLLANIRGAR